MPLPLRPPPAPLLALLSALFLPTIAGAQTPPDPARVHLAGMLVNDARDALRDPALPADAAAAQAAVLLQFAVKLDATDLRMLHLLAQTAEAAGQKEARRDALRKIIAADPGDLVAQMHYIDLLAGESQTIEDRAAIFKSALAQTDLAAQLRSEVALRLARLAEDRGETAQCREYLAQAVKLNDVNVGALRDQVRLAAALPPGPEAFNTHVQSLVTLLAANPYQPDAWLQVARICQAANAHDRAAEFMETAAEQFQIDGTAVAGDLYLELAIEYAIAGQRAKAATVADNLAQLPDAPLAPLLVAELLSSNNVPAPPPGPPTTQPSTQRGPEIRKRLAELAKDAANAAALADAAGADLTILSTPGAETPAWIDAYAKLVLPEDATLARLKGWLLYRQGKLADAQAILEKSTDPLAQVGLARVLLGQGKTDAAGKILQDLWNANPTGLLALQIALAARQANLTLADSASAKQVRGLVARLTPASTGMHRMPREAQLIMVSFRKPAVGAGEPALLQIRISNTTDRALPVGDAGIVKSTIGLAAVTRGAIAAPLGLFAIEDLQRVFRLEPHQMIEATVRVDQGKLADLFDHNPGGTFIANVTLVAAPRVLNSAEFTAGIGGQAVSAGDFERAGLPVASPAELQRLAHEVASLTGDRQLVSIEAAGALLAGKTEEPKVPLILALEPMAESKDPVVKAALLRALPATLVADLEKSLTILATDYDPMVRLLYARHQAQIARLGGEPATAAVAALEKMSASEKDDLLKTWFASALPLAKAAATRPTENSPPATNHEP